MPHIVKTAVAAISTTASFLFLITPVASAESAIPNAVGSPVGNNTNCKKLLDQQLRTCRGVPGWWKAGCIAAAYATYQTCID